MMAQDVKANGVNNIDANGLTRMDKEGMDTLMASMLRDINRLTSRQIDNKKNNFTSLISFAFV